MKKRMIVALTLVIGMVVSVACAQPPRERRGGADREGKRPGRGGAGFRMPPFPLLDALDADKDGKLSSAEIDNAVAALKKLDKDGDGELSREEIGWPPMGRGFGGPGRSGGFGGPGGPAGRPGGPGGDVDVVERIMRHDKNNDGKVTRDEMPEFMQRMLDRADTDKDGAIDKAEAEAMSKAFGRGGPGGPGGPGGGPDMVERIMSHDKNNDGKVTRDEMPERMRRMLDRADTNKDGAIDKDEAGAISKRMGRGGPGGRGGGQDDAPRRPRKPQRDGNTP